MSKHKNNLYQIKFNQDIHIARWLLIQVSFLIYYSSRTSQPRSHYFYVRRQACLLDHAIALEAFWFLFLFPQYDPFVQATLLPFFFKRNISLFLILSMKWERPFTALQNYWWKSLLTWNPLGSINCFIELFINHNCESFLIQYFLLSLLDRILNESLQVIWVNWICYKQMRL